MFRTRLSRLLNLEFSRFGSPFRQSTNYKTKNYRRVDKINSSEHLDQLIKKFAPKLIYNTVVDQKIRQLDYLNTRKKSVPLQKRADPIPITLQYLSEEALLEKEISNETSEKCNDNKVVNFPYDRGFELEATNEPKSHQDNVIVDLASEASEEVQKRYELQKEMDNWMESYDNYDDGCLEEENEDCGVDNWKINYGTPDPDTMISSVPCGGCGALLHCKDTAIPGYIPSEIFKNSFFKGGVNLEATVCQRCHFLKNYNLALQVQVTSEDYPKVLQTISQRRALVILLIDLLDFPCSIWPGIGEIFGSHTPIVVVGNKVDLLPQDSQKFLKHIKETLVNSVKLQGFATFNIKDVALISAKTGYGVEDLITKLNSLNRIKGDVYIVGCTNVGKSSLFNVFLQSDFCKIQAMDLIQRATTSVWPGTTLNLLKFPIRRPVGYRQYLRAKRLELVQKIEIDERKFRKAQLKKTKNPKYASLIGHIEVTKNPEFYSDTDKGDDIFVAPGKAPGNLMGINEKSTVFKYSKWCYDTPGVVQPDQLIHLLTTEELLLTLPKELIVPRTFCIKPNSSLFIAGLTRLDYVDGPESVKLTVFASNELPITVCAIEDAEELYTELLGTDLLKVPTGNNERLSKWPKLAMAKDFNITGKDWHYSVNDVVLSSAGWIAVTGREKKQYSFKAWTPEKRGVHIRDCLLPHAVALTGHRRRGSVAYNRYKFFYE